jgi:hypothetical protein
LNANRVVSSDRLIETAEPGSAQARSLLGSWAATPQQPELQEAQTVRNRPCRARLVDSLAGSLRDDRRR